MNVLKKLYKNNNNNNKSGSYRHQCFERENERTIYY